MDVFQPKRFAIALSYPGNRGECVKQVADILSKAVTWERVLYDKYWEAEFATPDLDVRLPKLYREQSELIVVFLCPEYQEKRWCRLEWRSIRQLIATVEQDRIMLLSFGDPGDLSELGILPGDGYVDIDNRSPEEIATLILSRAGNHKLPPLSTKAFERPATRAGNLRHANPNFVGRTDELQKLSAAVHAGKIGVVAAVHGVGGMGKTELAVSFAENEAGQFAAGLWLLNAEGHKELLPLLGDLTLELELPPSVGASETAEQQGRRVLAELKRRVQACNGSCLLILDNVSEPQLLSTPQLSNLPREQWLRLIVTTRLGQHKIHGKSLAFIPVDSLLEEDALALIREHQPNGGWPAATAAEDEAAAGELVRELGCFTLAVEAVAIYLGQHLEIRPSAYLARLRKEGLPSADDLGKNPDVAAQMQHREKQLALVLDVTLEKLAPAELAALEFASLLVPDAIPWPWLRSLVELDHNESLSSQEGYPDPWIELRHKLEGMRLLTSGDHREIARLHRLIGLHLLKRAEGRTHLLRDQVVEVLYSFCGHFEQSWVHDPSVLWLLKPLQETVLLLARSSSDLRLAENANFLAGVEMETGRLEVSLTFLELAKLLIEQALLDDPASERAKRDRSILFNQFADFFVVRGQSGDADEALSNYLCSLTVREQLLKDNQTSPQAARDVSITLNKLADFLWRRGQAGDADEALAHCRRSLDVRVRLHRDNPDSAQAARDVSVTLNKLADFLARRGQAGDAEEALNHYRLSLEILERLHRDNPVSAMAARDVAVALNKLSDFLARRGHQGDAEEVLNHYRRSLEIHERLHRENLGSVQAVRDVSVSLHNLADSLARRGLAGDSEEAFQLYRRSVEASERLLQENPESAQAARDVSVGLIRLADFLARRRHTGDAEEALGLFRRSLKLRECLLQENPDSALAARDVLVSLERLARALGEQESEESRKKALEYQSRSLDIALALRQANPLSFFYERTAAASYALTHRRAVVLGEDELAWKCLVGCHNVLQGMVTAGMVLDPPMMNLYEQLNGGISNDES